MATIEGTSGDDTLTGDLTGEPEPDVILGLAGDDLLEGQAGNDMLDGGNGDDMLFGGPEGEPTGEGETVILDFSLAEDGINPLNPDDADSLFVGTIYTEDDALLEGFHATGLIAPFFTAGTGNDFIPFEGSTALFLSSVGGTTTLSLEDDGAFTLESIDVDELLAPSSEGTITFTGEIFGGGTPVTQIFPIDGVDGFQTLEFGDNFTNLVSVSWDQVSPTHQFDNIVLTTDTGVDDGNDVLVGGTGEDKLFGGTGEDMLYGGTGEDGLAGGAGSDELFGGNGEDVLDGGAGDDILTGGAGEDILTGGSGSDTFVFGPGSGDDTITDFDLANDALSLDGLVIEELTEEDVDGDGDLDTEVTFDSGDTVTLLGVSGITEGDLVLV